MSNAVSALDHASFEGIAKIEEIGLQGMITLRGDLSSAKLKKATTDVAGVDFPAQGCSNVIEERGICWMSPDELLVLCPYASVSDNLAKIESALAGSHFLAANVSDARAVFQVKGEHAREVMAKLAPVDLAPGAFEPGMFRRTRMAQVPAAFFMPDATTFEIVCFRSVAAYMYGILKRAAQPGSEVGAF